MTGILMFVLGISLGHSSMSFAQQMLTMCLVVAIAIIPLLKEKNRT